MNTFNFVYHTIANTECTGFMDMYKVNGINHILDYHLFIRCGDKVYMDVKRGGDIVISFDELQKKQVLEVLLRRVTYANERQTFGYYTDRKEK